MTPEDPETQRPRQESGVAAAGLERAESGGRGAHGHGSRADTPHCHLWKPGKKRGSPEGP